MPIMAMSSPLASSARRLRTASSRVGSKPAPSHAHPSVSPNHLVHTQSSSSNSSNSGSSTAISSTFTAAAPPARKPAAAPAPAPADNRNIVSIPAERLLLHNDSNPSSSTDTTSHSSSTTGSTRQHQHAHNGMTLHAAGATLQGYAPGYKFENQDSALILSTFMTSDQALFAVMDGHGTHGARVSQFVRAALPNALIEGLEAGANPATSLHIAFNGVDSRMSSQAMLNPGALDVNSSGSTAIVCHLGPGGVLTTAWVGDSRAVLGRRRPTPSSLQFNLPGDLSGEVPTLNRPPPRVSFAAKQQAGAPIGSGWDAVALSDDHKPDRADEKLRITSLGGRVQQKMSRSGQPSGPTRVWLADRDFPGLAMTRAFGDAPTKNIGVTSDPQRSITTIQPPSHTSGRDIGLPTPEMLEDGLANASQSWPVGRPFPGTPGQAPSSAAQLSARNAQQQPHHVLLLASDGVWDVMSNEEAVDLVVAAGQDPANGSSSRGRGVPGNSKRRSGEFSSSSRILSGGDVAPEDSQRMANEGAVRLVEEAHRRWVLMYGGGYIDDISAVVVVMEGGAL